jgi:hypothetical protein
LATRRIATHQTRDGVIPELLNGNTIVLIQSLIQLQHGHHDSHFSAAEALRAFAILAKVERAQYLIAFHDVAKIGEPRVWWFGIWLTLQSKIHSNFISREVHVHKRFGSEKKVGEDLSLRRL